MTTTTIPLNKLIAWDGNVSKTDSDKAISELAAPIAAHGLLQSLVVRKDIRRGISPPQVAELCDGVGQAD